MCSLPCACVNSYAVAAGALLSGHVPLDVLSTLYSSTTVITLASRLPQIRANFVVRVWAVRCECCVVCCVCCDVCCVSNARFMRCLFACVYLCVRACVRVCVHVYVCACY